MSTQLPSLEARVSAQESMQTILHARIEGDMVAMEGRMLDAFKQVLTLIDSRLPPPQA